MGRGASRLVSRMKSPLLISVHFPKAGGVATLELLTRALGEQLVLDYTDDPGNPLGRRQLDPDGYFRSRTQLPREALAIHGHFHPAKYADVYDAAWFTVLRHPVPWVISLYWYYRAAAEGRAPIGPMSYRGLQIYITENHLSVFEMARLPIVRTMFTSAYFEGFDMRRFDYIGRHEDRAAAMAALSRLVGRQMPPEHVANATPPNPEMSEMLHDQKLQGRLADVLADQIRFYERWVS